nr:unnamed protein product [Spirometra erinaceieuropaei]
MADYSLNQRENHIILTADCTDNPLKKVPAEEQPFIGVDRSLATPSVVADSNQNEVHDIAPLPADELRSSEVCVETQLPAADNSPDLESKENVAAPSDSLKISDIACESAPPPQSGKTGDRSCPDAYFQKPSPEPEMSEKLKSTSSSTVVEFTSSPDVHETHFSQSGQDLPTSRNQPILLPNCDSIDKTQTTDSVYSHHIAQTATQDVINEPLCQPDTPTSSSPTILPPSDQAAEEVPPVLPELSAARATENPSSTHAPSSVAAESAENESYHQVRWITFNGKKRAVITQNKNGPCPMLALANVLLLRGTLSLPEDCEIISGERIIACLSHYLFSLTPEDLDDEDLPNYEKTVSDALNVFPSLQTGLDINVRFTGVTKFEYTSALGIFDLFKIGIYHGWVVDPNDHALAEVIQDRTYNQLVEAVIGWRSSENPDVVQRGKPSTTTTALGCGTPTQVAPAASAVSNVALTAPPRDSTPPASLPPSSSLPTGVDAHASRPGLPPASAPPADVRTPAAWENVSEAAKVMSPSEHPPQSASPAQAAGFKTTSTDEATRQQEDGLADSTAAPSTINELSDYELAVRLQHEMMVEASKGLSLPADEHADYELARRLHEADIKAAETSQQQHLESAALSSDHKLAKKLQQEFGASGGLLLPTDENKDYELARKLQEAEFRTAEAPRQQLEPVTLSDYELAKKLQEELDMEAAREVQAARQQRQQLSQQYNSGNSPTHTTTRPSSHSRGTNHANIGRTSSPGRHGADDSLYWAFNRGFPPLSSLRAYSIHGTMQSIRHLLLSSRSCSIHPLLLQRSVRCVNTTAVFGKVDKAAAADAAKPFLEKLLEGDRSTLARSITLVESLRPDKRAQGQAILAGVMQHMNSLLATREPSKTTFRVGLSGPPGAGKSTFIEALGCRLTGHVPWGCSNPDLETTGLKQMSNSSQSPDVPTGNRRKHKVAVLAVDPSSSTTGGSLLADKTRMQYLSQDPNAFIRPSPNSGHLGGVARATNETVVLCEGCGYDTVLVETVVNLHSCALGSVESVLFFLNQLQYAETDGRRSCSQPVSVVVCRQNVASSSASDIKYQVSVDTQSPQGPLWLEDLKAKAAENDQQICIQKPLFYACAGNNRSRLC